MDCGPISAILGWVSYWLLVLVTLVMGVIICFLVRDRRRVRPLHISQPAPTPPLASERTSLRSQSGDNP